MEYLTFEQALRPLLVTDLEALSRLYTPVHGWRRRPKPKPREEKKQ